MVRGLGLKVHVIERFRCCSGSTNVFMFVSRVFIDLNRGPKYGLKFQRVRGVSNNALNKDCDVWGYVGGTLDDNNHKSYRVKTRTAAFTQPSGGNQQQDIEFNFCKHRVITYVKMWPLHKGHQFTRGTLQYYGAKGWVTVSAGKGVLVDTKWPSGSLQKGNAWEIKYSKSTPARRWRIHNWRTWGNQRVDGIDLKMQTCSEEFSGLKCPKECESKTTCKNTKNLNDFVWGEKNGLKFKRVSF